MPGLVLFLLLISMAHLGFTQDAKLKYQDITATPEDRAADLVSRMSLEEKIGQMQDTAPAIPRLGVPEYGWWNEALHGVARAGLATVFPQAIGLAATWDANLEYRIADIISTEARAKYSDAINHGNHQRYYGLTFWSPNINIFRDPRWGRGQETYGEDPYLTAEMATAFIKGMQGTDPRYFKTIATSKHFAVHSGPESSRHKFDAEVSPADLDNTYLYAFRATLSQGGAYSVMCAYNSVDGAPACANTVLLEETLRQKWHFGGYVVSDCGAIGDIYQGHRYAGSLAQAAAEAVKAGTDLACGNEYKTLLDAVQKGYIREEEINRAVGRLLVARFRLGMFDPPERVPFSSLGMDQVASASHERVALEAAEKSIVLLKNEGKILPLETVARAIAVIGPAADDPDTLLGNYNGTPAHIVTPLQGIQEKFGGRADVRFALGSTYVSSWTALVPQTALNPGDAGESHHGLLAEYFYNENLVGKPALSRIEPRGYFVWDMHEPEVSKALPGPNFSVRWTASLQVSQPGDYELGIARPECDSCSGSNSTRMYIDNRLLVEDKRKAAMGPNSHTAPIHLEAGKAYKIRVEYTQHGGGSGIELVWRPPTDALLHEAVETAKGTDLVILCLGLNSRLEGEESPIEIPGFDHGDRTDLRLPDPQQKLLEGVLDTGKPVVVVLLNGSALGIQLAKNRAKAILEAWYPGQEGGAAIANTLAGENNPAGRLPVTFYESANQLPPFADYSMKGRTYRYFTGKPLYPFGYGLSYSDFIYSDLSVSPDKSKISARITNQSERDGDEVAQLYLERVNANPELRGFQRIHLRAHDSRIVDFSLAPEDIRNSGFISMGGGQPRKEWTGSHYLQMSLPQ